MSVALLEPEQAALLERVCDYELLDDAELRVRGAFAQEEEDESNQSHKAKRKRVKKAMGDLFSSLDRVIEADPNTSGGVIPAARDYRVSEEHCEAQKLSRITVNKCRDSRERPDCGVNRCIKNGDHCNVNYKEGGGQLH